MTSAHFRKLAKDRQGVTIVEFAMIAPVFFATLMGIFDLGYNLYTTGLLEGSIQKAARDSTIEGAAPTTATLDAKITHTVRQLAPGATVTFSRKSYSSFSDVGRPEDFADLDASGICDNGEAFEDVNGNGEWDADMGKTGLGGARDAVLYSVNVTYPRLFPVAKLIGLPEDYSMTSNTVLRNQPYGLQTITAPETGNCT